MQLVFGMHSDNCEHTLLRRYVNRAQFRLVHCKCLRPKSGTYLFLGYTYSHTRKYGEWRDKDGCQIEAGEYTLGMVSFSMVAAGSFASGKALVHIAVEDTFQRSNYV